jgi:Xaa-Pro aminopeptidase
MQYSPKNNIPYISLIDAGTIELIRDLHVEIISSAELVQQFEGRISPRGYQSHKKAGQILHRITKSAFDEIGRRLKKGKTFTELSIQNYMTEKFREEGITNGGSAPQVAVNEHAANPHFDPSIETNIIKKGDLVLIDSWGKIKEKDSFFYDFTWMAYCGENVPTKIQEIWDIVTDARDLTVEYEKDKIRNGEICYGWELDDVCRNFIKKNNYGNHFLHRTGHSIGREVHGNAVNLDNLETKDDRKIIPGILHSIEPGIYIPEEKIGIRSEIDVYVNYKGDCEVTGEIQTDIIKIGWE